MSLGGLTLGGTALGNEPVSAAPSGVELFLDGIDQMAYVAAGESGGGLTIERALNEGSTADLTLWDPPFVPTEGQTVRIRRDGLWRFGGTIDRVAQRRDGTVPFFQCTCVDWMQILDRTVVNKTYLNQSVVSIVRDLIATELAADGIWEGLLESGVSFPLVKAEQIRASECVRDVAEGSGYSFWIDPLKGLYIVKAGFYAAPFALDATTVRASPSADVSREQYCNVQIVKVTGTSELAQPEEVLVERINSSEVAGRQAREGGTGRYEVYTSITHPISNDPIDLQRLGITYGVIRLARSGQSRRTITGNTDLFGLEPGQLATVNLSDYGLSGTWIITRVRERYVHPTFWRYDFEAVQTSPHELELDAYLQLVGAGRAVLQLAVGIFANIVEFASSGNWTVPGSGDVELELDGFAAGGGGGGRNEVGPTGVALNGGGGGNGGKAVAFLSVPAGSVLAITIPSGGTGGLGDTAHTVSFTTVGTTSWTVPGTGNVRVEMTANGGGGGSGSKVLSGPACSGNGGKGGKAVSRRVYTAGTVLDVIVGGGGAGGGVGEHGFPGALSKVSLTGTTIAQGAGGGGGEYSFLSTEGADGLAGGGIGDSVTTGGGATGGAERCNTTAAGLSGATGSVVIRYADSDDGIAAGNVTVSLAGAVKMQANGGQGGASGAVTGAVGANGGGIGDQVFVGQGSPGGAGGIQGSVNGKVGSAGKVQIRY